MATRRLPPAEEVVALPDRVDLQPIRAPKLSGWLLAVAVWLLESVLGPLLLRQFWRAAGVPQVLRELQVPEDPTYAPVWPHPQPPAPGISVEGLDPPTRAAVAAQTIPGFFAIREGGEVGGRQRRWEVADFAQAFRSRLATPTDVARSVLEALRQAQAADPPLASLTAQDPGDLLAQAQAATDRHVRGEALSPLDGVPFAVIDSLDALPYPTTSGTAYAAAERRVTADAPCVAALRAAGAVLVGKAALHELGIGMTGLNPAGGTARNPHDLGRAAGGAASGSAAVVSAGICAFALGVDGGGSVRVPAALCGVAALKPTVGRSCAAGSHERASAMCVGVIAASVADLVLVSAVISNAGTAGALHPPPPTVIPRSLFDDTPGAAAAGRPKQQLRGTRLGVHLAWADTAQPQVAAAFRRALRQAAELGCEIVEVALPELELVRVAQMAAIGCEIAQACKPAHRDARRRRAMNAETRVTLASTSRFLATDFLQAQRIRTRLMTHLRRAFAEADCLATPTTGITAPPISAAAAATGEADMGLTAELMRFTIPPNMGGVPALSLPIGHDSAGLPIGLQLVGRPWHEAQLLHLASALEAACRPALRLPGASFDVLGGL